MNLPQKFPMAKVSAGYAPLRPPNSIRRTTSIDSNWLEGWDAPWEMIGRARDLLTPLTGEPVELSTASFRIITSPEREMLALEAKPAHPLLKELVGLRAGKASRTKLAEALGDLRGTPLFQLLDDFAGASLVARWIWSLWNEEWAEDVRRSQQDEHRERMVNICTGFAEGASSLLDLDVLNSTRNGPVVVVPLENPDDPAGWHTMLHQQGPQMRRARRIDLWREDGLIKVDAGFQDSGSAPEGGRVALHEYRVYAEVDEESGTLVALQALPLVLPFSECPGAAIKASRMIGQRVSEFRSAVIETLPSTLGCTHLNDVLRALADVPALAEMLPNTN